MSNENDIEKRKKLAFDIAKEAINDLNIPILDNDVPFTQLNYALYYQEIEPDIILCIELKPLFTTGYIRTSIVGFVWNALYDLDLLHSNSEAREILDLDDESKDEIIHRRALDLTKHYILYLPTVFFHAFHQTAKETIISYIKKMVEVEMRDFWQEQGFPDKFTLIQNDSLEKIINLFPTNQVSFSLNLETIDQEYSAYRKAAFKNRNVWLEQNFDNLPQEYEELRQLYKTAQKEHKAELEAFSRINRGNLKRWETHWEEFFTIQFPILIDKNVDLEQASFLAYKQMAEKYDFSVEYISKLIKNSRAKAKLKAITNQ